MGRVLGDLPSGFEAVTEGRLQMLVRAGLRDVLAPLLRSWSTDSLPLGRPLAGGRGGVAAFDPRTDVAVVLRPCRRGGWIGRFNRDHYFGYEARPFHEVAVTEHLRTHGVPTVEMLAGAVRWIVPGCYRGAVVSREVPDALNLWQALQRAAASERSALCAAAAATTRRLHDAGAVHPDLNLQNYLLRRDGGEWRALIIDCDRVRLAPVSPRDRRAAFARLCRSIRRLDPHAAVVTLACVEALRAVESSDG